MPRVRHVLRRWRRACIEGRRESALEEEAVTERREQPPGDMSANGEGGDKSEARRERRTGRNFSRQNSAGRWAAKGRHAGGMAEAASGRQGEQPRDVA